MTGETGPCTACDWVTLNERGQGLVFFMREIKNQHHLQEAALRKEYGNALAEIVRSHEERDMLRTALERFTRLDYAFLRPEVLDYALEEALRAINHSRGPMANSTPSPSPIYDIDEYRELSMRTAGSIAGDEALKLSAIGLSGETGEFADTVKKVLYHAHPRDALHMAEELGDNLWYIALASREIGIPLSTILRMNVEKLKRRYPNGFSEEASRNRVV